MTGVLQNYCRLWAFWHVKIQLEDRSKGYLVLETVLIVHELSILRKGWGWTARVCDWALDTLFLF